MSDSDPMFRMNQGVKRRRYACCVCACVCVLTCVSVEIAVKHKVDNSAKLLLSTQHCETIEVPAQIKKSHTQFAVLSSNML